MDIENKMGLDLSVALAMRDIGESNNSMRNKRLEAYERKWELIIRYTEDWIQIARERKIEFVELLGGYGIIYIGEDEIEDIVSYKEILYIDKPKKLVMEQVKMTRLCNDVCVNIHNSKYLGEGVYVAVIDSGLDIFHEHFNDLGENVIYRYWDQYLDGKPPKGYNKGYEFLENDIEGMKLYGESERIIFDASGHGTAVASIVHACASKAKLIIVRLDNGGGGVNTADLMMAIDYCVRISIKENVPLVLNLSYGNNYGDHAGNSILENYIASVTQYSRCGIVVGSGNEGMSSKHAKVNLQGNGKNSRKIIVGKYNTFLNIQLWRTSGEDVDIFLEIPSGKRVGPINRFQEVTRYNIDNIRIVSAEGVPNPINRNYENYIIITSVEGNIQEGEYIFSFENKSKNEVVCYLWLPVSDSLTSVAFFETPELSTTLTIPSTARNVITVGAYDNRLNVYAAFSGRGYTIDDRIKPDVVAPGVDVLAAVAGGGYGYFTGTSFATPYVAGIAARLMEYGIVKGNNIYMYGEALTAEIIRNAVTLDGIKIYPNNRVGYGLACAWSN